MVRWFFEDFVSPQFAIGATLGIALAFFGLRGLGPCGPSTFLAGALVSPGIQVIGIMGDSASGLIGLHYLLAVQALTGGLGVALAHRKLFGT